MSRIKITQSLETLYPDPKARASADDVVDELPVNTTTIAQMIDAWDAEYFRITGYSPFRKK